MPEREYDWLALIKQFVCVRVDYLPPAAAIPDQPDVKSSQHDYQAVNDRIFQQAFKPSGSALFLFHDCEDSSIWPA